MSGASGAAAWIGGHAALAQLIGVVCVAVVCGVAAWLLARDRAR